MTGRYDIAIVGAGMAGASLAAALGARTEGRARVLLLEAEDRPGYHATGRSAAPGFIWLAGQGGNGVMGGAAAARLAASLATRGTVPEDLSRLGITGENVSPTRECVSVGCHSRDSA